MKLLKKKNPPKEKQNWRKRETIGLFVVDNLEGIGEREREVEMKYDKIYMKIKKEEEGWRLMKG